MRFPAGARAILTTLANVSRSLWLPVSPGGGVSKLWCLKICSTGVRSGDRKITLPSAGLPQQRPVTLDVLSFRCKVTLRHTTLRLSGTVRGINATLSYWPRRHHAPSNGVLQIRVLSLTYPEHPPLYHRSERDMKTERCGTRKRPPSCA